MPPHAHIGNEENRFHKKQRLWRPLLHEVWKRQPLFHSPMCINQPLKVMELGALPTLFQHHLCGEVPIHQNILLHM